MKFVEIVEIGGVLQNINWEKWWNQIFNFNVEVI